MGLSIVLMDINETILEFVDNDLVELEETISKNGLRTLSVDYIFEDFQKDKELFQLGNKLWIQGDKHLNDCLYVINTEVTENVFDENKFSFNAEEVLVELNYAPIFSQTELGKKDGDNNYIFKRGTTNNEAWVEVNYNALNYWFGDYFNIGVVQECATDYASRININGTIQLMNLLRYIEEETGNIFVTRYEKDCLNNQIHRYLDFLNPNNINKDWTLNLAYDFVDIDTTSGHHYDSEGHEVPDDKPWEVTPFDDDDQPLPYDWNAEDELDDDSVWYSENEDYTPTANLDVENTIFQITNKDGEVLDVTGGVYDEEGDEYPLLWTADEVGLEEDTRIVISLCRVGKNCGLGINNKSYAIAPDEENYVDDPKETVVAINNGAINPVYIADDEETILEVAIPDNSYFEIYDTSYGKAVFRTQINNKIGEIREEILDFTYNMESVEFQFDETETYTSISPILKLSENSDSKLTRANMTSIINDWKNLSIAKGDLIPFIITKDNVQANGISTQCDTQYSAQVDKVKCKLGDFNKTKSPNRSMNVGGNYWSRPVKPNDNINTQTPTSTTFEFWRATSYWRAPFSKKKGQLYINTEAIQNTQYKNIRARPDARTLRGTVTHHKNGTVDTSEEDPYAIYNILAQTLKEKQYPKFKITVDVSNYKNGTYNNYQLYDKVYIKLPGNTDLVSAHITKTVKNANDISKNTIEIDNYSLNTIKVKQHNTYIECPNYSFHYPSTATLVARLVNEDYDAGDSTTGVQYPGNRLIKLVLYKLDNGSRSSIRKMYTKITNLSGYVKLPLKFKPGNYEIDLNFGGDEEYFESSHTIRVNVSGQVETKELKEKAKVVFKHKKKKDKNTTTKTVKTYWGKCGQSPTAKKNQKAKEVVAIAKPSDGTGGHSYTWWKTVFKNHCPECGKNGTLVYDSGTARTHCVTCGGYSGSKRTWNGGIPEGEISCNDCCSDFDGVSGYEKDGSFKTRLTIVKQPVRSSETEMNKLLSGKLEYETKKVTVKKKNIADGKNRKRICQTGLPKAIINKALSLVGNKTGQAAAKEICKFMGGSIGYSRYSDFLHGPISVLSNGCGNCCDQTRLMLQLMDAAGLSEFYKMYYVHVSASDRGHVFAKLVTRKTGEWRYVDPCKSEPWGHYVTGYGEPPGSQPAVTCNNLLNGIF